MASGQRMIDREGIGLEPENLGRVNSIYEGLQNPRFLDGELDCSDFVFPLKTEIDNAVLENKKDCEIIQDNEEAEEYLEELIHHEQKCWEYASESYEDLDEDVEELIEDIEDIDEYIVEEDEREKSPTEEYAEMMVMLVQATVRITSDMGDGAEEAIEEMRGVSYREDYKYNIRDRLRKVERKVEKSCNKAKEIRESLGQICRFVNNEAFLQGGLSEEQKAATISQIRRELEKKEQRLSEAEEKHEAVAEKGADFDAWFYDSLSERDVLGEIREDCRDAEIAEMMGRLLLNKYGNKTKGERISDFLASQKNIEGKELTGILGSLFGNEKINVIINDNGEEKYMNIETRNKKIAGFGVGKGKNPGMRLYMSKQDASEIIESQDIGVLASGVREGRIRYEGVGFAKKIKLSVVGFFSRLAGFG